MLKSPKFDFHISGLVVLKLFFTSLIAIVTYFIMTSIAEAKQEMMDDLNRALSKKAPITCGDVLRDKSFVYIDSYINDGGRIVDKKTHAIWHKGDCRSYFAQ